MSVIKILATYTRLGHPKPANSFNRQNKVRHNNETEETRRRRETDGRARGRQRCSYKTKAAGGGGGANYDRFVVTKHPKTGYGQSVGSGQKATEAIGFFVCARQS
ncbi:hypothetical protein GWI33_006426 [Rhynchophorus ferrugineus]|uniref:Uncharacterized protein n=1 Tax=Rhynchophorus ferrugineus TaxID=354439 RepID=A0A834ILV5_RHYFE|nr:hypothetical protein GWI33_006426 [Rhynchophorus ferrugineus]